MSFLLLLLPSVRLPPQPGPAPVSGLHPPNISSSTSFFPSTSTEPNMSPPPQTVPASSFPLSAFLSLTLLQPILHPILMTIQIAIPAQSIATVSLPLYNCLFIVCRNISCSICRSLVHYSHSCPLITQNDPNPQSQSTSESVKSTSCVPQSESDHSGPVKGRYPSIPNHQVCNNFNNFLCFRQLCRFLHVCNFCGSAHARPVCPVYKSSAKKTIKI